MNLLIDPWIPVRPREDGLPRQLTLRELLCEPSVWTLHLPRDDMELAALQLLICLAQVIWPPKDQQEWQANLRGPLSTEKFEKDIAPWLDTFRLDHPQTPFMQVRGVKATEPTGMDKLLAGLTGATNCAFVNEPGLADALCGGCTAIALFNQANNAPSFGGGFKSGLRGGSPVTTLLQGTCLRSTIWLNVLVQTELDSSLPQWRHLAEQLPTWQQPIKEGGIIPASDIGLLRGLFWQPDHIELCEPIGAGVCSGCGHKVNQRYSGFLKAKFSFTVQGMWLHPHSPRLLNTKKGEDAQKFLAFTTEAPSWTQLGRIVVEQEQAKGQEGHMPASVIRQAQNLFAAYPKYLQRLRLIIGGYRNNQASVLERRHEVLEFSHDWYSQPQAIMELVTQGLHYKTALRKALFTFAQGVSNGEIKGAGVSLQEVAEPRFFSQSEPLMLSALSELDFKDPLPTKLKLGEELDQLSRRLFADITAPYSHHPKHIKALAVARRTLHKHLSELKPQGAQDGE